MIAGKSSNSTLARYESYWKHFQSFSVAKNKLSISIQFLIQFFFSLFKRGLALRTMSAYRASLADPMFYGFQLDTNSKLIRDFFIACRTRRPIRKVLPPQWEVDKVLGFLKTQQFKHNSLITLPALLLKTLFLIALATGSRISEVCAFRRDELHCSFSKGNSQVKLSTAEGFRFKSERKLKSNPILIIPALLIDKLRHSLCPVEALKIWIERTSSWPNPDHFIWFNAASKKPANSRILALRFKQLIRLSHSYDTSANFHQIRKAATSLAFDKGLSLKEICSRANWGSKSVFFKNYYKRQNVKNTCISLGHKIK